MLRLDTVTITQGDFSLHADLSVPKGAKVAVLGPSGAGKSTVLGAIAGFVDARGRILWDGQDLAAQEPAQRPMTILFQDNNLFPHLSVWQNVALGLRPSLRLTALERDDVAKALADVDLTGLEDRRPAQLSGGQQSRVALARALIRRRPLLLLDEPFAALGPALKSDMLGLVARLCDRDGTTLLMVTHAPEDARAICPKALIVAEGQVSGPFDTDRLLDAPPPSLRAYLGSA